MWIPTSGIGIVASRRSPLAIGPIVLGHGINKGIGLIGKHGQECPTRQDAQFGTRAKTRKGLPCRVSNSILLCCGSRSLSFTTTRIFLLVPATLLASTSIGFAPIWLGNGGQNSFVFFLPFPSQLQPLTDGVGIDAILRGRARGQNAQDLILADSTGPTIGCSFEDGVETLQFA